jgi:serine/threonine-protein kinase
MGRVIAGEHAFLGRPVAIKLLHRTLDQDPLAGRRFLGEARAASRIRHPGVVEILDYGVLDDGRPYMVMERLAGESLQDRLDRDKALDPVLALLMAREIAAALGAAHAGGVVRLDLKPANVILLEPPTPGPPRVKLIDFGAAVGTGLPSEEGTPAYMSPEHACGEPADPRSDLYALGVVLFELISGDVPFRQSEALQVLRAHLVDPPPLVTSPMRQLPVAITRLVDRALAKKPAERHQSADDMIRDIDVALAALRRKDWLRWLP